MSPKTHRDQATRGTMPQHSDSGRKKILYVPYRWLVSLIGGQLFKYDTVELPKLKGLPEGFTVCAVHESFERHAFAFIIHSEEFPETEVGLAFPEIEVEWECIQLQRREQGW